MLSQGHMVTALTAIQWKEVTIKSAQTVEQKKLTQRLVVYRVTTAPSITGPIACYLLSTNEKDIV